MPFVARKAAHTTRLRAEEPSAGRYDPDFVPDGATAVRYPSANGDLLAWQWLPADVDGPVPAIVYFHGAFALAPKDALAVRPFLDAGFAVLAPAWRGENGNPGHQELLYGEVDDAISACTWFANLPATDGDHLYAVGHSMGGGIAALVALHPDAPVRFTASIGGLYVPETFVRWEKSKENAALIRFDPRDRDEGELRTLVPNVADLAHPHYAFIGDEDTWFHPNAEAARTNAAQVGAPLTVQSIAGDHMNSLDEGITRVIELVRDDLKRAE